MECKGKPGKLTTYLCQIDEIGDSGKEVSIVDAGSDDTPAVPQLLMLFRRGDRILAFHNVCPHIGRSLNWGPDQFLFTPEGLLVCPHHGASFDLDQAGVCIAGPCPGARLTPMAIELRGDQVFVAADPDEVDSDGGQTHSVPKGKDV